MLLTGCSQRTATDTESSAPVASSYTAASPSSSRIGGPAAGNDASLSGSSIVGAGSFPRSFLMPGTNTSIRIGGE
jgi:hypothetical protein